MTTLIRALPAYFENFIIELFRLNSMIPFPHIECCGVLLLQWCVAVLCCSGVLQWWFAVVVCSGGLQWCVAVVFCSGVLQWCVAVVCCSGVLQ